jgi:hypothetical protein
MIVSPPNKYTDILANYSKNVKDSLKDMKASQKESLTADKGIYNEFNTLVLKYNKYRKIVPKDQKETKGLAKKMKALSERVHGITLKVNIKNGGKEKKQKSSLH